MFLGTEDAEEALEAAEAHGGALDGLVSWLSGGFGGTRASTDPDEIEEKGAQIIEHTVLELRSVVTPYDPWRAFFQQNSIHKCAKYILPPLGW